MYQCSKQRPADTAIAQHKQTNNNTNIAIAWNDALRPLEANKVQNNGFKPQP